VITDSVVRARIDQRTKEQATHVLEDMGLSVSDAIRMLMVRIAAEKALPFEVKVPNADTVEAIEAGRRGDVASFRSVKELMADLNAED
jgi:DNA-damage-inducible protein J